ncbi:hypothetical protein GCM10009530_43310 [Microbispora corallina]|uniref:Flagellar biosynthetic protein FliP n=1 Tax=Microbispora corallina TaxID=83302 RepID=A0ABQ4FX65_9ACTN|nr:hypothetical protein [Microbispora corallina]GIH39410.1 hypothetical protein Mco01_24100 [Microbispora corallina]
MTHPTPPMPASPPGTQRHARRWGRFTLHYIEMIIAMFAGMIALGLLWSSAFGIDLSYARDPELAYLLMAFDMSAGMGAWMRFRGHPWASTLEMCGVMFAPVVPLFPLLWLDAIDGMTLMIAAHVAMFPLMLAVMLWRRDEYAHAHH